jgi:hypothetical protein
MKQDQNKLIVKVPRIKQRADFLFHNGQFKPKCEKNLKAYDRKKLAKPDIDIN